MPAFGTQKRRPCMTPLLTLSSIPEPEIKRLIGDGLNAYNDAIVGYADRTPLTIAVTDPATGKVLGGISGRTSLGLLFIDLVYLPDSLRGSGVGQRMLALAEAEAVRRGCKTGVLYTINFEASAFYEKSGWRIFGDIPCDPPGTSRVFLQKQL